MIFLEHEYEGGVMMKKNIISMFLCLLTVVGISGVNSYCFFVFGQEEEPQSLSKYRKHG